MSTNLTRRSLILAAPALGVAGLVGVPLANADVRSARSTAALTITQAQTALAGLDYYHGKIDGQNGNMTKRAASSFQIHNCLAIDGNVGPSTSDKLVAKVKAVQTKVKVTADGSYGTGTKAAVVTWQKANGLTGDGITGPSTMAKMGITRLVCGQGSAVGGAITRAEAVRRADFWVRFPVPYSMEKFENDQNQKNYRTDCSGFVSLAWHLASSTTTYNMRDFANPINKADLKPGDVMNVPPSATREIGHVRMFTKWVDSDRYEVVEQAYSTKGTHRGVYSYAATYAEGYRPLRYKNIS